MVWDMCESGHIHVLINGGNSSWRQQNTGHHSSRTQRESKNWQSTNEQRKNEPSDADSNQDVLEKKIDVHVC